MFIPHNGCPEKCSFCNQCRITGRKTQPTGQDVLKLLTETADYMGERVRGAEIAFFGGSFTAIDRSYMLELLEAAHEAIERFGFHGIRCSTRPDAIDRERLDILRDYGVTSIELGAQSMQDSVLLMNRRGHTAEDVRNAAVLIREYGFELGLQMMTGLPGDTDEGAIETAKKLLALKPDTMRVYPTIVLENTEICDWYRAGAYTPQTLEAAVSLCAELIPMIENAGVRLIRVGLHASEELEHRAAGPFHPAFMELCRSRIFLEAITAELRKKQINTAEVAVAPQMLSIALGQKRSNMEAFSKRGYKVTVRPDATLSGRTYRIEETGR